MSGAEPRMSFSPRFVRPGGRSPQNTTWFSCSVVHYGMTTMSVDPARGGWSDPFWRFYVDLDPGEEIENEDGSRLALVPRRICVLPGWQRRRLLTHAATRHIYVTVDVPQLPATLVRRHWPVAQLVDDDREGRAAAAAIIGVAEELDRGEAPSLACSCRLQAVVHTLFARLLAALGTTRPPPPTVVAALDLIETRGLAADLRASTLARPVGLGAKRLDAEFRRALGASVAAYVRDRRLARAADLLMTSAWDIDRIAEEAGFPNRHYLSRVFTRRMGLPPARYRTLRRLA